MKSRILSTSRLSFPLASAIAALLSVKSAQAANETWDGGAGTGTAWFTATNWLSDTGFAGSQSVTTNTDVATFNATGTGTPIGIDMNFTGNKLYLGAIEMTGNLARLIGNSSSTAGTLVLNGATVNSVANTILRNSSTTLMTIQATQAGAMGLELGNATNNIIQITNSGGITIDSIISGSSRNLTFLGTGTGVLTLSGANTYTGATNILAGQVTISNASTFNNTSAISLGSAARLTVNAANANLSKLATGAGGSGVVAGSFLRYSQAQTTAGAGNGPGTIFGTVELNVTNANPDYTLDFGAGGALTNLVTSTYTSPITLSGTASIDSSTAVATYTTGGITASTAGLKTLNLTGSNTGANTISSAIGNGSGSIGIIKGGAGTWVLSGTNTYTGNTRVDAGILQFTNQVSLYNNGSAAAWTKDNIIVGDGATLAFNIGGAGQFTKANIVTLLGLSNAATNGFTSRSILGLDTTAGSFLYDSVIANTNGGSNVLGLTKLGTNTLTLDQDNTYTGRTVISAGTLQLGNGGTTGKLSTSSAILNNGTVTINRSDAVAQGTDFSGAPIAGTGAFIQAGAGTTTLNAANTFSGTTTVSGGNLTLSNALALQNSALVTTGSGSITLSGVTTPTFGGLSGTSGNLATVISSGYSGVTSLTLNPLSGSVTYGGVISNGAANMTLTKTGAGTQILTGANTYTGATIVNAGTLTVGSGANGSLSSSSTLQMSGGIFNYSRTGAGQTVNGLTVNAGNSTVNNTSSGQTLTLGAITRTGSVYGAVNFATLTGPISTTTGNTNGIIGPWATTGATTSLRYAVGSADGSTPTNISALTGTTATAGTLANVTDSTANYEYSAAATTSADLTANTLRYSGGFGTTAIGATNTLTLNGLMNAGNGTGGTGVDVGRLTISGGPSSGGIIIGSTNELVVTANAQNTTISAVIKDGGAAGRLIYNGGGTLTLSGANTYSGGFIINSGIVATGAAASGSAGGTGTGAITVNAAGRLTLNTGVGTLNRAMTLNGGSLFFAGSGNDLIVAGTIVLGANSTIDATNNNSGFPTITADISGTGGFTKTNLGGLRLNGANTYTGPTVVSAGGVTVKSSLYGNDTSKWTPANITVASGATLVLNVAGSGEFTIAQAATMFSQLSSNVNNNGLLAGSFIGVDTRNATAGTYTYSANITDSTGAGGGAVSFKHTGTANTILELTGTNTYSGMSVVDNGSFLRVSSLNSVFTNAALGTVHSASSSLGAPTTVANGTIHLGTGGSTAQSAIGNTFQGGGLIYTGTGETTDRVISLNGGGNETYTLDQSGTGHLKFLSSFASLDNRAVKTLLLRGSTAGTGELAGVYSNAANGINQLTKSGTGTWILSGANLYTGLTTVSGGALVLANANALAGGIGATGGLGAVTFNGGVIGLGAGDFSRPLAAANTIGAATFTGAGGWAAYGADRLVNLGGASATITWATTGTGFNGQTLILGNATATHMVTLQNSLDLGNAVRTVQVDNGAAAVDGALSGVLSGTGGGLTKTGAGALALSANNNYTGATLISGGSLQLGVGGSTGALTGTASVTNNANLTVNRSNAFSQSLDLNGKVISGSGSFTQAGGGTTTLSLANTYTGTTAISAGTLSVGNIVVSGGSSHLGNAASAVTLGSAGAQGTLSYSGSTANFTRGFTIGGAGGGRLDVTTSGQTLTVATGSVTGTGLFTVGGAGDATISANLTHTGGLTKTDAGTLTITGTGNTYTGNTTVNQGTMVINGNISTSLLTTVTSGATLGGGGTVGALTINSGGFVTPGNSPGILTVDGNYIQAGTYTAEIDGLIPETEHDQIDVTGEVNITGGTLVALFSGTYSANDMIFILLNDGTDAITGTFSGYAQGDVVATHGGLDWQISYLANSTGSTFIGGNDIALRAVPEPRAALLTGLGLLALLRRRRRD